MKLLNRIKCFFHDIAKEIRFAVSEKQKRTKAINIAQSRMSEDGSPTHAYDIAKKVPLRRLEKGLNH